MLEATPIPVAAGSLVVGVITFVVTEVGKWRRARRAETRQWQLDTLGTILSEDGSRAKDFRAIKAQYLQAAEIHKDFDISKQYKQDNEIQRALFELQSKGIISQDNAGYYKVKRDQTEAQIEEKLSKTQQDVKKLTDEVMKNVMQQASEGQKTALEQIQAQTKNNLEHLMANIQNFQSTFVNLLQKQEKKIETYHNDRAEAQNYPEIVARTRCQSPWRLH